MVPRWLARLAVLAVIAMAGLIPAGPAEAADGTVPLQAMLPAMAKAGGHCADVAQGIDLDVWVFRVAADAEFVSLELRFVAGGGARVIRTVDPFTSGGGGVDGSEAWISTEAGWSLVGGTAVVTGMTDGFSLAEACAAQSIVGLAPISGGLNGPARPVSPQAAKTPRALAAGMDIGATVTLGATLVLAGLLLLIVRRRPRGRHRAPSAY